MKVYISGPLTGDPWGGVHRAVQAAECVRRAGHTPFVPHLFTLWETITPGVSYEEWMRMDLEWLEECEALIRLPGESPGAVREVEFCRVSATPVFDSVAEFLDYAERERRGW